MIKEKGTLQLLQIKKSTTSRQAIPLEWLLMGHRVNLRK
jgi:hypothetical protein